MIQCNKEVKGLYMMAGKKKTLRIDCGTVLFEYNILYLFKRLDKKRRMAPRKVQ